MADLVPFTWTDQLKQDEFDKVCGTVTLITAACLAVAGGVNCFAINGTEVRGINFQDSGLAPAIVLSDLERQLVLALETCEIALDACLNP